MLQLSSYENTDETNKLHLYFYMNTMLVKRFFLHLTALKHHLSLQSAIILNALYTRVHNSSN